MKYNGSCHCQNIQFSFEHSEEITAGVHCDCSLCKRKGAMMSNFLLSPDSITIETKNDSLSVYEFGTNVAKHFFCNHCGIYTFHQTMRKPGHYRVNLGCVDGINTLILNEEIIEGSKF